MFSPYFYRRHAGKWFRHADNRINKRWLIKKVYKRCGGCHSTPSFQSNLDPKGVHLCSGVDIKKTLHADDDELFDWEICPNFTKANKRMNHTQIGN